MSKLEVLSGDIQTGDWEVHSDDLRVESLKVKKIPYNGIVEIIEKGDAGKRVYVEVKLTSGECFYAVMKRKDYSFISDRQLNYYYSKGDMKYYETLPTESVSSLTYFMTFALFVSLAIAFFNINMANADSVDSWEPKEFCSILEPGIKTGKYKKDKYEKGRYYCFSPSKNLPPSVPPSKGAANHIAYYVDGDSKSADTLEVVLIYSYPDESKIAREKLIESSKKIALKSTGKEIPDSILKAIKENNSSKKKVGEMLHEVVRTDSTHIEEYRMSYKITDQRKN